MKNKELKEKLKELEEKLETVIEKISEIDSREVYDDAIASIGIIDLSKSIKILDYTVETNDSYHFVQNCLGSANVINKDKEDIIISTLKEKMNARVIYTFALLVKDAPYEQLADLILKTGSLKYIRWFSLIEKLPLKVKNKLDNFLLENGVISYEGFDMKHVNRKEKIKNKKNKRRYSKNEI